MKTKNMILCGLAAAITAVLAPISFPVGAVSITLALFAVMLSGGILKPAYAFVSQVVYILLGCIGLPIFSNFRGGFQMLTGPTGGYLAVYPLMALLIAVCIGLYERYATKKTRTRCGCVMFFAMLAAVALCYATGATWFSIQTKTPIQSALALTVYPFIPGDLIKAFLATCLSLALRRRMGNLLNKS